MPLKEIFIVALLIWAGSFLCMIPEMIDTTERAKISQRNKEINTQNTTWAKEELRRKAVESQ